MHREPKREWLGRKVANNENQCSSHLSGVWRRKGDACVGPTWLRSTGLRCSPIRGLGSSEIGRPGLARAARSRRKRRSLLRPGAQSRANEPALGPGLSYQGHQFLAEPALIKAGLDAPLRNPHTVGHTLFDRRTAFPHTVGCTFAFSRNRFFGSYLFLRATSRG